MKILLKKRLSQLLLLQQILFFRELGFKLDDIQKVLAGNDFDKIRALYAHKSILEENLNHTNKLIYCLIRQIAQLIRQTNGEEDNVLH